MLPLNQVRDDGKWLLRNAVEHILRDSTFQVGNASSANKCALQVHCSCANTKGQQVADLRNLVLVSSLRLIKCHRQAALIAKRLLPSLILWHGTLLSSCGHLLDLTYFLMICILLLHVQPPFD